MIREQRSFDQSAGVRTLSAVEKSSHEVVLGNCDPSARSVSDQRR
ncbi:unnamed protein product [Ectocarpus fasciculatus]